ncbi:MAG TPA: hypothetical protein VGH86_17530 [Phenylobacterium sp.]
MFWKVYAVFYLVLVAVGLPQVIGRLDQIPIIEQIDLLVLAPVAVLALWSKAFRHISLPKNGWKFFLFGSVFWRAITLGNAFLFGDVIATLHARMASLASQTSAGATPGMVAYGMAATVGAALFLTFPPLVALYRNAYGHESLLQLMSPSPRQAASADPVAKHLKRRLHRSELDAHAVLDLE